MSNKQSCPACGSHTSAIWSAFEDGAPCPYCGLPADSALQFEIAQRRGADEALIERTAKAEALVAQAEHRIRELERQIQEIRWIVERKPDDE
jgi:hypothetical protein